jgi:hypothetical protein
MRQPVTDLPTFMENAAGKLQSTPWGGMTCSYARFVAGTDLAPLLEGLPDDKCPCPHWGYILQGAIRISYSDGRDEIIRAGDVFYLPPGHAPLFLEDTTFVEFSPESELNEVLGHVGRKLQG